MPARQPFTVLCQNAATHRFRSLSLQTRQQARGRADLHLHTTSSDGSYTPVQIVELGLRSGLAAVAITDHDTTEGVAAAQKAAAGTHLEIIPGVEITSEYLGRELHLLGYFIRLDSAPLRTALKKLREQRISRFWEMVDRLRSCGIALDSDELRQEVGTATLGRRHLAKYLVKTHWAGSVREVFSLFLNDKGRAMVPKTRLPIAEAIQLVHGAGGVASWAHPFYDCNQKILRELQALGLGAVEVEFPNVRPGRSRRLRSLANDLGLAVTAGSDCHGPDEPRRAVGCCSVTAEELDRLRRLAGGQRSDVRNQAI